MAELFLELLSEEIPAGMQARAARDLSQLVHKALADLNPKEVFSTYGTRRLALSLTIDTQIPARIHSERGPRETAPEKALAGFMRKHNITQDELKKDNGFWVLERELPARSAANLIAETFPDLLWNFPWPKAMRWGKGSLFSWVRPLHYITCLLDGEIVPFSLMREDDDAHGLTSGNISEGHRFLAPGTFTVKNASHWREELQKRFVVTDDSQRRDIIQKGVAALAQEKSLKLVEDDALTEEISGLVEYPVPLLGTIESQFMDLPAEVMQVSMRVNQRYFALKTQEGKAAPYFAFVANRTFDDHGSLCIAGNERVLRARFADARHFWDLDRKTPLADRVQDLEAVTFHAKLGTQEERSQRISALAGIVAKAMGLSETQINQAKRAGLLAKTDLTTGMVGEFPELQGIMGGYYAAHDGEDIAVSQAIAEHYKPRGQDDTPATASVSNAVALADRLDMLAGFFGIGEVPSGSGDPYALRRSALGVIRIIRDNNLRIDLGALLFQAAQNLSQRQLTENNALKDLEGFFTERLKVQLKTEGKRHDILDATLAVTSAQKGETLFEKHLDGDLVRLLSRVDALSEMIEHEEGKNLLAAYRRGANILRIENKKDGPHKGQADFTLFTLDEERNLEKAIQTVEPSISACLKADDFRGAMRHLATLRPVMDSFFENVTVNANEPEQRKNRLLLLAAFCQEAHSIADFNKIEG
ncbi:glycine--tRNA ligase subunit beta [Aristophania vespae]|uniref:glycine--tRNA ligase subunit beta n=1 Tax=Aristophania vespae TaxID=2697033 RepID=UPI0023518B3C|nr:glycine--tRNA ligase subunit beta [Aristophania vespae]UMM64542.1 Glycine--tRNA ligase beta subunit [Aristophania vespae]